MLKLKLFISRFILFIQFLIRIRKLNSNRDGVPYIYLINIPSHGNMGDQLIAETEMQFLQKFSKYEVVQITSAELWASTSLLRKCIGKDDIICITGGGYLGSLWPVEEYRIRSIIEKYGDNKIIIFPQTVFYEETEAEFCKNAKEIYDSHSSLYFLTRERHSFDFTKKYLMPNNKDRVFLVPDIALTYKASNVTSVRTNKVLFCLRTDKEKIEITNLLIGKLKDLLSKDFIVEYTDTQVPYSVPILKRTSEIQKKIEEFSAARVVITDRLHGMIYAAVCGTPVIALDNTSGKVGNVYKLWLKNMTHVLFVNNENEIQDILDKALATNHIEYDNEYPCSYFEILNDIIK